MDFDRSRRFLKPSIQFWIHPKLVCVSYRVMFLEFLGPMKKPKEPIKVPAPAMPNVDAVVNMPATGPSNNDPPDPPISQPDCNVASAALRW